MTPIVAEFSALVLGLVIAILVIEIGVLYQFYVWPRSAQDKHMPPLIVWAMGISFLLAIGYPVIDTAQHLGGELSDSTRLSFVLATEILALVWLLALNSRYIDSKYDPTKESHG
jgi:hypothetical protein